MNLFAQQQCSLQRQNSCWVATQHSLALLWAVALEHSISHHLFAFQSPVADLLYRPLTMFNTCLSQRSWTSAASQHHNGAVKGKDYLTSVPTEVLVEIVSHIPSSSYNNLFWTSKGFRHFFKDQHRNICNRAIMVSPRTDLVPIYLLSIALSLK